MAAELLEQKAVGTAASRSLGQGRTGLLQHKAPWRRVSPAKPLAAFLFDLGHVS